MAISKLATEHHKHRGGFFAAVEVFIRPINIPYEEAGQGYHFLKQAVQTPLIIFTQLVLPTADMHRLRRAFRVLRGAPDVSKASIKDGVIRHEIMKALREHCRKLRSSLGEITVACQMAKGCVATLSNLEEPMMRAQGIGMQLRDYGMVLKGRYEEARRGGPFGPRTYAKNLEKKATLYGYAAARVMDMSSVADYAKSIIAGYSKVIQGIEAWVDGYAKKGVKLHEELKKKDDKADVLRDKYNLYLEEGRVFRLALERFYFTSYTLRTELGMVPQMVRNDAVVRQVIQQFLETLRRQQ